jgi:hypothetical protein
MSNNQNENGSVKSEPTTIHVKVLKDEARDAFHAARKVEAYLPSNYVVVHVMRTADGESVGGNYWLVVVAGYDDTGWTAVDFVIPRLASGSYAAQIVENDSWLGAFFSKTKDHLRGQTESAA